MRRLRPLLATTAAAGLLAALLSLALGDSADKAEPSVTAGNALYERYCLACHGEAGDGKAPAAPWLWPAPRDFTKGRYKWRSTPSGKPPTDDDLTRIIREGAPGTSMPGFAGILDDAEVAELVVVVKAFAPKKRFAATTTAIAVPDPPDSLADLATRGEELFASAGCASCHGAEGRGDGASAKDLKDDAGRPGAPFDLGGEPLRRGANGAADIYLTLATGIDGTAMPAMPARTKAQRDDLWALAAYVESIRWRGGRPGDPTSVSKQLGKGPRGGLEIDAQGDPPVSLPPAAASLSSAQCGRCHAKQLREWETSLHAATASPGLLGQLHGTSAKGVRSCQSCHAPLAEQQPDAPGYDADLRHEGITCAACHVRGWTRRGPRRRPDATLLPIASYPFQEDAAYERSDFCLPCHQLGPETAVAGRPLLNTYREWLEGPYMRRGVQCQHCHMPDREHTWKGAHDPATVKQGLDISAQATRADGAVTVTVLLENIGAGHYLPTTPTPAAFVRVVLVDAKGRDLPGAAEERIGRHIAYDKGWKELSDTRIPPGETRTFAPRWPSAKVAAAKAARVVVTFAPDEYYEGFYARLLKRKLVPKARSQLQMALERAQKSRFTVWDREVPIR